MTQQEQQLLNGLIERVNGTQLPSKDDEAERLLGSGLGANPDALYILCQTVLVQQFAMDNAQRQLAAARAEIDTLKQTAAHPQEHGSFLGNLFGLGKGDSQPSAPPAIPTQAAPSNAPSGYAPVHNPGAPQYGYPQQPPPPPPGYGSGYPQGGYGYGGGAPMGGGMFGGGGGFLQGAMQTAAGVVAGEFAFRAIEDVFHMGGGGFGGGGGRGFDGGSEVVNNYYGNDSGTGESGGLGDRLRDSDGLGSGLSPDIEDRRGDAPGFFGGGDDGGNDGSGFTDDSGSSDDSGSFDDSGTSDSGSNDDSGF